MANFLAGVVDTGGKLPPVLLTPVANLRAYSPWGSKTWSKSTSSLRRETRLVSDSVTRFSTSGFFQKSVFPKPLSITLGLFRIFSIIRGDIRSSRCTTVVVDTGGKWKKIFKHKSINYFVLFLPSSSL
jgi:hypothetical protein